MVKPRSIAGTIYCLLAESALTVGCGEETTAPPDPEPEGEREPAPVPEDVFSLEPAPFDQQRTASEPFESAALPPQGVDPATWELLIPDDNVPNAERIALGRRLFF